MIKRISLAPRNTVGVMNLKTVGMSLFLIMALASCRLTNNVWEYSYPDKISRYTQNQNSITLIGEDGGYEFTNIPVDLKNLLSQQVKLPDNVSISGRSKYDVDDKILFSLSFITRARLPNDELKKLTSEMDKLGIRDHYTTSGKRINFAKYETEVLPISDPYKICVEHKKSFTGFVKRFLLTPFTLVIDVYADIGTFLDVPNWKENFSDRKYGLPSVFFRPASCGFRLISDAKLH